MNAPELIRSLGLTAHPEGGWYKELYRSAVQVAAPQGTRAALTGIYYLLEHGQQSRWHVVASDEAWHFYAGEPLVLLAYDPAGGRFIRHVLGPPGATVPRAGDGRSGSAAPVAVIPAGWWQAAWPLGGHALVGCSVAPGFDFVDFKLVAELPAHLPHFKGELAGYTGLL